MVYHKIIRKMKFFANNLETKKLLVGDGCRWFVWKFWEISKCLNMKKIQKIHLKMV